MKIYHKDEKNMDPDQQALLEVNSPVSTLFENSIYGPAFEILALIELSSNEGLGEPGQLSRLTRTFAACIHKYGSR